MTEQTQIKNIIAFLSILFGDSKLWADEIMKFSPEYLIEKFNSYIEFTKNAHDWGLHPTLRRNVFEPYCIKHKIPHEHYKDIE